MWSIVNAYFNILQVHSFQKEYIFMFPKQKIHTLLYLVNFLIFFSTKYAGNAEWDFKITTYFPNTT